MCLFLFHCSYSFILIGRVCEMTETTTYKDAVSEAMGPSWGKLLALTTTFKTLVACLMYSIIIGDTTAGEEDECRRKV